MSFPLLALYSQLFALSFMLLAFLIFLCLMIYLLPSSRYSTLMSYLKRVFPLFFLTVIIQYKAFSQQDSISINSIIEKTAKLSSTQPLEKAYLHLDKPYYAAGDTIWFKAYVTTIQNQLSPLSKILYVEMISESDSLVQSLKLPLAGGTASGSIPLPELIYKQGNYRIRAYTKWMLNSGEDYLFHKTIPIAALNKPLTTHISFSGKNEGKNAKSDIRIQYKDADGRPYASRKVNWRVQLGFDDAAKGKGSTDEKGFLELSLTNSQKQDLSKGRLITELSVDNTKTVTRSFPLQSAFNALDVQFFPEGGELIDGVPANIAFKAVGADGLGKDIKGRIIDNTGHAAGIFTSTHLGMGVFSLNPKLGKTYKAEITSADGSKHTYPLPAVKKEGISLQINSTPQNLNLLVSSNSFFYEKNKGRGFYIIAQNGTVVYYAAQTQLSKPSFSAAIPVDKFPPGILQVTLFSSSGEPLSERLVFIQPANGLKLTIQSDRPAYNTKQKVRITLNAANAAGPAEGNFSAAVIDEKKVPFDKNAETTILNNLLLTSDLKGFIEKPNYYFTNITDKTLADLDVLMMTQGWRRFSYKDILADKYPQVSFLPEQSIDITGTLRTNTGMPVNKGSVRLYIPDRSFSAYAQTDADGRFKFSNLDLADTSKVIISSGTSRNMMIMVDGGYFPALGTNINYAAAVPDIDSSLDAYIQNSKRQFRNLHVLEAVVVKSTSLAKPSYKDHAALSGLSMPDHVIDGNRFSGCQMLLTCLQTSATGLTFEKENFYITRDYNNGSRIPVQIYLNGMPVDVFTINSITPAEVESIEIFLKDELGLVNRAGQSNGVLAINTKKKPQGTAISKQQLLDLLPKGNEVTLNGIGFTKVREFYSPRYDAPQQTITSDLRSTIYWNPRIITDQGGKAVLEYYNADGRGTYRLVVEGIDANGNIGRSVYRYTVK